MKSDMYKLIFVTQRPSVKQANNIGTWNGVITVMAWLAIVTNTFIMGMTSEQLECVQRKFPCSRGLNICAFAGYGFHSISRRLTAQAAMTIGQRNQGCC